MLTRPTENQLSVFSMCKRYLSKLSIEMSTN
nr:MAG TPA: hypothetical protein [Caudoviricetes sp.]